MKLFTLVIAAIAVLPAAFSTKAEHPSHLRRLNPSQEGGFQEWPGPEGEFGQGGLQQAAEGHVHSHEDREDNRPELVAIECDAMDACDLGNGEEGTWACRSMMVDSSTGDALSLPMCIPNDQAWSTDECGCCKDDTGNDLECPPSQIQLDGNVTGIVSDMDRPFTDNATGLVTLHGDNSTEVVAVLIVGDNETGLVTVPLHGDDMNEHAPVPAEKTQKAGADNSEEGTDPDTLTSTEQAAVESSGALKRWHRALMSTALTAVGIHSLW